MMVFKAAHLSVFSLEAEVNEVTVEELTPLSLTGFEIVVFMYLYGFFLQAVCRNC